MAGTGMSKVSHGRRNAGIAAAVVVLAIGVAGFVVTVPVSTVAFVPVAIVNTVETTFVTSSVTQVPVTQSTTATGPVWSENDISLKPNYYDSYAASLTVGTDVELNWQASGTVNVYVFTSAQYNSYTSSSGSTTSPNVASGSAANSGLTFHISGTDTYYLVVENPNNGFFGFGSSNVGYTTSGSETYPTSTTTYIVQTVTYTTSTPTVVTSTSTSTTTKTCSFYLWMWLDGSRSCP